MTASTVQFWDKIAPKYIKSKIKDEASYEEGVRRMRAALGPEDRVLELGCGTGMTAIKLALSAGHIHATDISPAMIDLARARGGPGNVTFDVLDLAHPWAEDAASDTVIALNLLHLLSNLEETLAEVYRQLRPGGLFISKSSALKGWRWFFPPLIRVMQALGRAPHVEMFTSDDLATMIRAAGFEIEDAQILPDGPPRAFIFARKPA